MDQTEHPTARSFEQLYLKERKKARIFMATTVVTVVLTIGSGVYAINKKAEPKQAAFSGNGQMMPFKGDGPSGGPNIRMQLDIKRFLKSDGSVDTAQINDMLGDIPNDFRDNFLSRIKTQIDEAKNNSDITADQATALKAAFGIPGDTNGS